MMAAKSTPSLNEAPIHRSKRSTAGINSRYNQTPSSSQKKSTRKSSKSTPLHANAKSFTSKNSSTSGNRREWGEWPSGLRRCYKNRKVPGSNPARRSAGLRDPTSLRGSR